jgi:hypothetical protein
LRASWRSCRRRPSRRDADNVTAPRSGDIPGRRRSTIGSRALRRRVALCGFGLERRLACGCGVPPRRLLFKARIQRQAPGGESRQRLPNARRADDS